MRASATAHDRVARIAAPFCLGVGLCEVTTGLGLVAQPELVLRALRIAPPATEAMVYLRFVGVFVACVGVAYLLPLWLDRAGARGLRMRSAIEMTAMVRLAVALFLATAVLGKALPPPWLFVGAFDGAVAIIQLALRERGAFGLEH